MGQFKIAMLQDKLLKLFQKKVFLSHPKDRGGEGVWSAILNEFRIEFFPELLISSLITREG